MSSSAQAAFLRAVADKRRAFVGEQVTVTWYLYLAEPQSNFQPVTQPKSDGFWMEEIPSTNPQGRLAFTDQVEGGQHYQVAVVLQRALFPLAPGKLTVTAMEAQVSRADFFGRAVHPRRLKSEPLTIEAVALPRDGLSRPVSRRATSGSSRSTSASTAPPWRSATPSRSR